MRHKNLKRILFIAPSVFMLAQALSNAGKAMTFADKVSSIDPSESTSLLILFIMTFGFSILFFNAFLTFTVFSILLWDMEKIRKKEKKGEGEKEGEKK